MDATKIATLMALIPERASRVHMGSAFRLHEDHGERIALVSRYLSWMTPLVSLSKDEQRALGLLNSHPRSIDVEAEEGEAEVEAGLEPETETEPAEEVEAEDPPFDPDATLPGTFEEEAEEEVEEEVEEVHAAANIDP